MKKVLFYCDTSYQVLTVINIILGREEKASYDLVLYHQFYNSDIICEKLKQSGLFKKIYDAYPPKSKKADLLRLVKCKKHVEEIGVRGIYDEIYFAILDTHSSLALYTSCIYKEAFLYDDGIGSYRGNIVFDCLGWKRHLLLKTFHPLSTYFKFSKYLLYSPALSNTLLNKEKIIFHQSSIIEKIFGYKENHLYSRRVVYIDQPYNLSAEIKRHKEDGETKINIFLEPLSDELILRLHPRSVESCIKCGIIDSYRNTWEIECVRQITNEHVFISIFSTAMFAPAIFLNKRPHLIFLYKLFKGIYTEKQIEGIDSFLSRFKKSHYAVKIDVPENWDVVERIIIDLKTPNA